MVKFFGAVGEGLEDEIASRVDETPVWLSTSGLGVYWYVCFKSVVQGGGREGRRHCCSCSNHRTNVFETLYCRYRSRREEFSSCYGRQTSSGHASDNKRSTSFTPMTPNLFAIPLCTLEAGHPEYLALYSSARGVVTHPTPHPPWRRTLPPPRTQAARKVGLRTEVLHVCAVQDIMMKCTAVGKLESSGTWCIARGLCCAF